MIILTSIMTATITIITVRWCVSLGPLGSKCQDGIDHADLLGEMIMSVSVKNRCSAFIRCLPFVLPLSKGCDVTIFLLCGHV